MTRPPEDRSAASKTSVPERRNLSLLTPRQRQIALLLAQGYRKREIAAVLAVDKGLVKHHVREVQRRLGVFNRQQLATYVGDTPEPFTKSQPSR